MSKLVLFGAGVYAKKYKSLLEYCNLDFHYFTDNDESKWGSMLFGREIIKPDRLIEMDCRIMISCTHNEEIKQQLLAMGILEKLLEISDIYDTYLKTLPKAGKPDRIDVNSRVTVLFDMYEGIGWGGTEMWAADAALALKEFGHPVWLLGSDTQTPLDREKEELVIRFPEEKTIEKLVEKIKEHLPCVVVNNFAGCVLLAAVLVKMKYPDLIQIHTVIHNDNVPLFDAHFMFRQWMEHFFCVSSQIKERIIREYGIERERVYAREPYIEYDEEFTKAYSNEGKPIQIGYAARLVKQAKRVDLFPELIRKLEKRNVNYRLEIAGEGECKGPLEAFVAENGLDQKVVFMGRLAKDQMPEFWKRQDLFLSLSEHEGASLSMLEAMSQGCVPVVTLVSGVAEYICDQESGLICQVGDLDAIAQAVAYLDSNRKLLPQFGAVCRQQIRLRCRKADYIAYLETFLTLEREEHG